VRGFSANEGEAPHEAVSAVIPGMGRVRNAGAETRVSAKGRLGEPNQMNSSAETRKRPFMKHWRPRDTAGGYLKGISTSV
jgi:hypothetical protein